jgi:prepilin-type processing-associated H-X9-DG protein
VYFDDDNTAYAASTTKAIVQAVLATTTGKTQIATWSSYVSGVINGCSVIEIGQISDGTSNTYLCGEKCVNADCYETGDDFGDDTPMYNGHSSATTRWSRLYKNVAMPYRDTPGYTNDETFGSPHAGGMNMALCDGSVRQMSYGLSSVVHANLCNRKDGAAIDVNDLAF